MKEALIKINRKWLTLVSVREFLDEAGRRIRRLHRYIKGWCKELGEWLTICLGAVETATKDDELRHQAHALFSALAKRIGLKQAMLALVKA